MRRIIIVTAVHPPGAPYLADAYKSICAQDLPDGWDWRWVIQEDGRSDEVAPHVPDDERVVFHQGRAGGPGVARTMTLAHLGDGEVVKVLDADDQLTPGALARDLEALANPAIGWATSRVLDLMPDGSTVGFPGDPDAGPIERGAVVEFWKANNFRASVHPATLAVRRELLLALGGWMALPASEDTGLLLALNTVARGWFTGEVGLHYRKWPGQATAQSDHVDAAERDARMGIAAARVDALAWLQWRYPAED